MAARRLRSVETYRPSTAKMNHPIEPGFRNRILRFALESDSAALLDEEVFIKTRIGRIEAAEPQSQLPRRLRTLLILVDGRRTMGDFRRGLTRFRNLDECFDMLRKMGYIETLPIRLDSFEPPAG
jgi:hypothetical protein